MAYYNKVEITGINTSRLPVMKEAEKIELLGKIKRGENPALCREKLVNGNLKLVLSVVQRFVTRGENLDDLFQVGCIGLIKAVDNFDVSQNVRFSTYAVPMIIGEIRRYLRDTGPIRVSRSLKDLAYKTMKAKEHLMGEFGREPSAEEIAEAVGVGKEEIVMALEAIVDPLSLSEPVYSDGGDTIYVGDQLSDKVDDKSWTDEIALKTALDKLSDREKMIMSMRFFAGKTQVEVASEIDISQAQVSRLEKNALKKLRG